MNPKEKWLWFFWFVKNNVEPCAVEDPFVEMRESQLINVGDERGGTAGMEPANNITTITTLSHYPAMLKQMWTVVKYL